MKALWVIVFWSMLLVPSTDLLALSYGGSQGRPPQYNLMKGSSTGTRYSAQGKVNRTQWGHGGFFALKRGRAW